MSSRIRPRRRSALRQSLALVVVAAVTAVALVSPSPAWSSSHREAPNITKMPQTDGTDFYLFRSYEAGRSGYVTLIANYNPLQDPYGGPNYFPLDPDAFYDIHITNDGDTSEDLTFRFKYTQNSPFTALTVGVPGNEADVAVPLSNIGAFGPGGSPGNANLRRSYTVRLLRGPIDNPSSVEFLVNLASGENRFAMPLDNIGTKSIPDYDGYASQYIYDIGIPGCGNGRIFVGQRREGFQVNLGEIFDLVNTNPLGGIADESSDTAYKNVTSLALEVPIACLTEGNGDVIAGWTTARLPRNRTLTESPTWKEPTAESGDFVQVSRLANPLVNEVAIGLPDKDLFNASHPSGDPQFLTYVTHPTLPELLEILFGVAAPNNFPRNDLVAVFLTGVSGLNADGSVGEMMRLNTAIAPISAAVQNNLGVVAGDNAGYPNGRRPGDDTVDISLRAVMGLLCHLGLGVCDPADAPSGTLPYTDGADNNALQFDEVFPYLVNPLPGSPN